MGDAERPADELRRQAALYALGILDTEPEEEFDRIARLAQRLVGVPSAVVSFMDDDRQWYKAKVGVEADEAERSTTFCTHLIADGRRLVVEDATADDRFADNPHVMADDGVRFYAGVPIHSPGRHVIGTVCVFGNEPRTIAPADLDLLSDLAAMVDEMIEARQLANADEMTGLQNRRGFLKAGAQLLKLADRAGMAMALGYFDLDGLKPINDQLGHEAGDFAIAVGARVLAKTFREADLVARMGGDEFAVLFALTDDGIEPAMARLREAVAERNERGDLPFTLSLSAGIVDRQPGGDPLEKLLHRADQAMYERKRSRSVR